MAKTILWERHEDSLRTPRVSRPRTVGVPRSTKMHLTAGKIEEYLNGFLAWTL